MSKTGLVIEGGGMRGIYAAGVLDVFMDHGITFDGVIGVSAGAIHGISYISGQKGRSIRYYQKYLKDWRFMSVRSLLATGSIVGTDFCYREIPEKLDPFDYETFANSETEMYCVCSNLETGKPEYMLLSDIRKQMDVLRASASMPYVSRTVFWEGVPMLDGGCTDSIPVRAFMDLGYDRNVVIQTRDEHYIKMPENMKIGNLMYRKYPEFTKALDRRHTMYNRQLRDVRKLEEAGEIFVIRPSRELTIGRMEHDKGKLMQVYNIGRKDAAKKLSALRSWLESPEHS